MAFTLAFLELAVAGTAGLPEERLREMDWDPFLVQAEISGGSAP
jgi:hypothetical protein